MQAQEFKKGTRKFSKAVMMALAAVLIASAVHAQEKMKIAVMEFNPGVGVDASTVNGLSDMLINSLFDTRKFTIVERNQLNQVLKEQGFQRSSISAGQIARAGRILGVKSVLVGTVNFMGTGEYNIDIRIVDAESGEVVSTAGITKMADKTYRDLMPDLAKQLTSKLFKTRAPIRY